MAATKVEPALTPEEWADGRVQVGDCGDLRTDHGRVQVAVSDCVEQTMISYLPPMKTAALCLHGQSFGFTREDVENLRTAPIGGNTLPSEVDAYRTALGDLADRIEALLPPE